MNRRAKIAVTALLVAAFAGAASVHTSYMQPSVFSAGAATQVAIETSFSEDFARPEIAVESHDFHLYRPDGSRDTHDRVSVLSQMAVLESDLTEAGTYRFTTGERLGRTNLQVARQCQTRRSNLPSTAAAMTNRPSHKHCKPTRKARSQSASIGRVFTC